MIGNTIKESRETVDYLIDLPKRLLESYNETSIKWTEVKERVQRGKQLVVLREIAKLMNGLYASKGRAQGQLLLLAPSPDLRTVDYIKKEFKYSSECLGQIAELLKDKDFGNAALAAEACLRSERAKLIFYELSKTSDEKILENLELAQLLEKLMDRLSEQGLSMLDRLDKHRATLDSTG